MTDRFLEKAKRRSVPVGKIGKQTPFLDLFPTNPGMVAKITEHMHQNGYDKNYPIIVWDQGNGNGNRHRYILVDGHTRLMAAQNVGMDFIYASCVTFLNEDTALKYAIHNQRNRRNMTDADLLRCIQAVDSRKSRGGDRKSVAAKSKAQCCANDTGKSAQQTALIFGVKQRQVEKVRTIFDHADEQTKQDVKSDKKSINKAYQETQQKRRRQKNSDKQKTAERKPQSVDPVFEDIHLEATRHLSDIIELALSASDRKGWKAYKNILFNAVHDTEIKIERIK